MQVYNLIHNHPLNKNKTGSKIIKQKHNWSKTFQPPNCRTDFDHRRQVFCHLHLANKGRLLDLFLAFCAVL